MWGSSITDVEQLKNLSIQHIGQLVLTILEYAVVLAEEDTLVQQALPVEVLSSLELASKMMEFTMIHTSITALHHSIILDRPY